MLIIGISGGSGSGKTTVVSAIRKALDGKRIAVISQDSYYKDNSHIPLEERKKINFDHPDAIDWNLLCRQLSDLRGGRPVEQPQYSYITCTRSSQTVRVEPADVIIVEGILIFSYKRLCELMDIKIFVDAEPDERLMRIIYRDILERGRNMDTAFQHYKETVKPMHLEFIEPTKRIADIIVPEGGHNKVAIELIVNTIEKALG